MLATSLLLSACSGGNAARTEFAKVTEGKPYRCPIPADQMPPLER